MYTPSIADFVSRSRSAESYLSSGQHSNKFYPICTRSEDHAVPLGFCSGGFSSTTGYVPGNEA
jgi:hypothetical protein